MFAVMPQCKSVRGRSGPSGSDIALRNFVSHLRKSKMSPPGNCSRYLRLGAPCSANGLSVDQNALAAETNLHAMLSEGEWRHLALRRTPDPGADFGP